jgi:hypothetical protein
VRLVQDADFRGEAVLGPRLLDVDERALARAVEVVLQRGEGDGDGIRFHAHHLTGSTAR